MPDTEAVYNRITPQMRLCVILEKLGITAVEKRHLISPNSAVKLLNNLLTQQCSNAQQCSFSRATQGG